MCPFYFRYCWKVTTINFIWSFAAAKFETKMCIWLLFRFICTQTVSCSIQWQLIFSVVTSASVSVFMKVSSANIHKSLHDISAAKWLIRIKNNRDTNIDPWGTPLNISCSRRLIIVNCNLFSILKMNFEDYRQYTSYSIVLKLFWEISWSILSKALLSSYLLSSNPLTVCSVEFIIAVTVDILYSWWHSENNLCFFLCLLVNWV